MQLIQNPYNTFQPNITEYYKTIQHLPNILNFDELLLRYDNLKTCNHPLYFKLLEQWEQGQQSHPPFVFGLKSGAWFSKTSILFTYKINNEFKFKQLPYRYMSMYLGNKESKLTRFLISQFTVADWDVIVNFCNHCTNQFNAQQKNEAKKKAQLLDTLMIFKQELAKNMSVLEYDQLLAKYTNFSLFEADKNWHNFHWYKKSFAMWKNGKTPYPPILFGTEGGLMFGKTGFIYNTGIDNGDAENQRYYRKTAYRNINHPDFENRIGKFLTVEELKLLRILGEMM